MLQQWIARQFRLPRGIVLGRLWGRMMNRGNLPMIASAVEQLGVEPSDRVLEVGLGGGAGLDLLLARAPGGSVVATELSPVLLKRARARYREEISRGCLEVTSAYVESLPFAAESFDRVLTVNTVYFWTDVRKGLGEIRRVLRPGGRLVIGFRPPEILRGFSFTRHEFTLYSSEQLSGLLEAAGFSGIRMVENAGDPTGSVSAVAHRPASAPP